MNIEHQVVSLELAKQLKEAGYPQRDSCFYWSTVNRPTIELKSKYEHPVAQALNVNPHWLDEDIVAAPTVAELGEKLPGMCFKNGPGELIIKKHDKDITRWGIYYKSVRGGETLIEATNEMKLPAYSEANARAKMWLYLKKENLL